MSTNGQLVFTDVDKITFKGVGNTSNAVVDTVTGKIGVGIDSPDANLHVLGNSYVSTNLELGGTLIMGTVNVSAHHSLEAVTAEGNTTPVTVEFSNATTGIVTTGNVEVAKELTVTGNATVSSNLTVSGNATVSSNLTVSGTGQTSTNSFNQAGALGSTLILKDDGSSQGNGGAIMFGASQGYFAAIKGGIDNGANNTSGRITFFTRPDWTSSTMSSAMTIKYDGSVGIGTSNPSKTLVVGGDVAFPQSVTSTDYSHNTTDRALYIGGKDSNGSLTQAKCAIISSPTNGGAQQYGRNALHFCVGPDSQDDVNASVSNSKLSIDHSGKVIVNGTLQIQGFDAKRVLIGYQKFENAGGTSWAATQTGWQNAWSVNYVRKKAGSQIYVTCDLCMAQAMGANGTVSYRHIDGRLKVYDQVTDRYSNSTRDWQRIDNSFHEYQRQSRIYYGPHTLPGAQAGWTVTVVAQVERSSGTGSLSSWGINIWSGRSVIEVYETMEA